MIRRALITGATGYIGSRLAQHLVTEGWTVHALVRAGSDQTRLPKSTVCHVHGGNASAMMRAVADATPYVVFHLAALPLGIHQTADVDPMIAANIGLGAQLLEAMAQTGCRNLIEAGSYWEYDAAGEYCPNSLYAATKHAFRTLTRYYSRSPGMRVITLLLYDVYGPGDWRGKFLSQLARGLAEGTQLAASPGEQLLDYVHVDDVVRGFTIAAARLERVNAKASAEIFRLDSGRRVRLRDLAQLFASVAGRPLEVRWSERPYSPLQIMDPLHVGPRLPGWEPQVSLEEGLAALRDEAFPAGARVA
jgi:nucleoside-diphosphate-sugar epimerase